MLKRDKKVGENMDYTQALNMVKDLLTKVEEGEPNREKREPRIIYGAGEFALTFRGAENVMAFHDTIEFFWTKDKELFETVAKKSLQDEVLRLVRSCVNGEELTLERVKDVFRNLKSQPIQTFELLYHVYGVEYFNANPLEIGPYTIYNTDIHRKHLLEKYPHGKDTFEYKLDETEVSSKVMIGVCEKTRDSTRADEKGLVKLRQFEDTIRFMIGDPDKNYDVGIFNFNARKRTGGLLLSNQLAGSTSSLSGTIEPIHLHKFPINEPEFGHDKLWDMLNKDNCNC
jgi:hypothetical protein